MAKIIKIAIIAIFAVGLLMALVKGLSREDDWICVNGEWVKHGMPSAPMPTESCGIAGEETMFVKVYFNNDKMDPEFSCNKVFPVERQIVKTKAVARAALEELLKGATENEKSLGFFSNINPGVKIQKLTIENGVARVDFDEQLEYQVGGSCRVAAIRWEITETLKQFPSVQSVIISINGRTEDILQP